ncbi:MAG: hypothetical protein U0802_20195 [Candidatus Binatia bacterium]
MSKKQSLLAVEVAHVRAVRIGMRSPERALVGGAELHGLGVELVDALARTAGDGDHVAVADLVRLAVVGRADGQHRLVHAGAVELDPVHAHELAGTEHGQQSVVELAGALEILAADGDVSLIIAILLAAH